MFELSCHMWKVTGKKWLIAREVEIQSTEYSTGLCTPVLPNAKRIYFYKTHLGLPPNETMNKYLELDIAFSAASNYLILQ